LDRIQGSVSTKDDIVKIVEEFKKSEKHLDVLVNCAGVNAQLPEKCDPKDTSKLYDSLWSTDFENDFSFTNTMNIASLYFMYVSSPLSRPYIRCSPTS
jgi:NAD(P)-dependent dehydrogenase (short-subunit alcohol dehydrogenase family)